MKGERIIGRTPLGFEYIRDLPEVKDYRVQTPKYARALKWTTEPPTVEGWYWFRCHKEYETEIDTEIAWVSIYNGHASLSWPVGGYECEDDYDAKDVTHWLGPLPVPEPPNKGE